MYARAAGRHAPRPRPARRRIAEKTATLGANATAMVKTEKPATQAISSLRRPNLSESGAMKSAPKPTPTREMVAANVAPTASKPSSPVLISVGITVPRTTRSKPSRTMASQQSHTGHWERRADDIVGIASSLLGFRSPERPVSYESFITTLCNVAHVLPLNGIDNFGGWRQLGAIAQFRASSLTRFQKGGERWPTHHPATPWSNASCG